MVLFFLAYENISYKTLDKTYSPLRLAIGEKNTRNPETENFSTYCGKYDFHESRNLSEIENPKSAPFSTKIDVLIDHTSKNIKKNTENVEIFTRYRMWKTKTREAKKYEKSQKYPKSDPLSTKISVLIDDRYHYKY